MYNILAYLCIFDGFLNFWGCFFVESLPNKTVACSHHCPLRHPAPSLRHWYTGIYLRIFDPGPSNATTFLGHCSPGDYRQSIESSMGVPIFNSTENALTFTIYDCILRIRSKKVCYFWWKLASTHGLTPTSTWEYTITFGCFFRGAI